MSDDLTELMDDAVNGDIYQRGDVAPELADALRRKDAEIAWLREALRESDTTNDIVRAGVEACQRSAEYTGGGLTVSNLAIRAAYKAMLQTALKEATMKVKLTRREPTEAMEDAGRGHIAWDGFHAVEPGHQRIKTRNAYEAAHDAAPDDATRALEQHLHTVRMVLNGEASLNDLGGSYDALQALPETAALIRQAEERSGST